jgi:hypothetical protein
MLAASKDNVTFDLSAINDMCLQAITDDLRRRRHDSALTE